ncbi:MAG: hypothetical protein JWM04_22 [Verrucomicrobiales bacterium]|jgi:hypothetical protein|nr:hypothetical protein [Verrucomicrobiales bacterium]
MLPQRYRSPPRVKVAFEVTVKMPLHDPGATGRPLRMSPYRTFAGNRFAFLVNIFPSSGTRSKTRVGEASKFCHPCGAQKPQPYCMYTKLIHAHVAKPRDGLNNSFPHQRSYKARLIIECIRSTPEFVPTSAPKLLIEFPFLNIVPIRTLLGID